jgi:hypothetical protein
MPRFKGQLGDRAVDALIGMMKHVDEFDSNGVYIGDSKGTDPIKGTDPMAAANAE